MRPIPHNDQTDGEERENSVRLTRGERPDSTDEDETWLDVHEF